MHLVYLILGGNMGDKENIFQKAIGLIIKNIGGVVQSSSVYETESWGFTSELFVNQVIVVESELSPNDVLLAALAIENTLGRNRKSKNYEARPIDIDLLFYDDIILESKDLTIPHPRIAERRFVLEPLCEIAAQKKHPVTGFTVSEMLINCTDRLKVTKIG